MLHHLPTEDYNTFRQCMPRACLDILLVDASHNYLSLKRPLNDVQGGEYWPPGGRIYHGETHHSALQRLIYQAIPHVQIDPSPLTLLCNLSVFLDHPLGFKVHDESTIYLWSSFPRELYSSALASIDHRWHPLNKASSQPYTDQINSLSLYTNALSFYYFTTSELS